MGCWCTSAIPLAHEDDAAARRAGGAGDCRGTASAQCAPAVHPRAHSCAPLQVRIGIHTGLVVAGEMGSGRPTGTPGIVGETPNIAARLQGNSRARQVVISAGNLSAGAGLV